MSRRLIILTEIIAPYRIPVFNALATRPDVDSHVIFLAESDETLRQWRIYRNEIQFSYQILPSWRWRAGDSNVLLNRGVWPALNQVNPQTIICGGYNYAASWEALVWARRHRAKFVLWSESNVEDARSGRAWIESLKRLFLRRCDGFVVPGQAAREYLKSLGMAEASISTAPNAVDNDLFATRAESARAQASETRARLGLPARFILFVGRLVAEKGVFDLLASYARLEPALRSEVGLVFVGDGVSRNALEERAKEASLGMVRFPGFVHREDLASFYALADVLVLPTHSDTWGLVVNEAMACGLPIVVSNVAGCASDLVENDWNGYITPVRDSKKLSEAIDFILRRSDLQQQMRANSLKRIRAYSPQACADGLAAVVTRATTGAR